MARLVAQRVAGSCGLVTGAAGGRRSGSALMAAAISVGTVAWLFSPLGRALTAWVLG